MVRNNGQTLVTSADYYDPELLHQQSLAASCSWFIQVNSITNKALSGLTQRVTSGEWTAVDTADVGDGRVMDRSVVTLLLLTLMTVVTSKQQQIGEGGRLGTRSKKLYLFRVGFWH